MWDSFQKEVGYLRRNVHVGDFWASTGIELKNKVSYQSSLKIQSLQVNQL